MSEQYFSQNPMSISDPESTSFVFREQTFHFFTDHGVFSRGELDRGTQILLHALPSDLTGEGLDLGCGWGALGICIAKLYPQTHLTLTDINSRAVELSMKNAQINHVNVVCLQGDGVEFVRHQQYNFIVTNPPIRAGKSVMYGLFSDGAGLLHASGKMFIVIRRKQGAESALKFLQSLPGSAEVVDKSGGFWVICFRKGE